MSCSACTGQSLVTPVAIELPGGLWTTNSPPLIHKIRIQGQRSNNWPILSVILLDSPGRSQALPAPHPTGKDRQRVLYGFSGPEIYDSSDPEF